MIPNNLEVRIVNFLYPSTLAFVDNNKKLVVMVLFNNGSGRGGADARSAPIADGKDVDGFHGHRTLVRTRLAPHSLSRAPIEAL